MSGSHIVESGDTLGEIASRYGLDLDDLVRWNGIENPDRITVGQKIELSGHEPAERSEQVYVVQPGDTVSGIAKKFGLRWIDIGAVNRLDDIDKITAGQELIIPAEGVARGPGADGGFVISAKNEIIRCGSSSARHLVPVQSSSQFSGFFRLGWTRGGSPGIFG